MKTYDVKITVVIKADDEDEAETKALNAIVNGTANEYVEVVEVIE